MNVPVGQAISLAWDEADAFIKKRLALTLLLVLGTAVFAGLAPIALKYALDGLAGEPQSADAEMGAVLGPTLLLLVYIAALWICRSLDRSIPWGWRSATSPTARRLSKRWWR